MTTTFAGTADSLADELGAALDGAGAPRPEVALVLGSGLGALADTLEDARAVPFTDLPSMPASTVPGHAGRFVAGLIGGVPVLCQQGRVHLYEGWSAEVVTRAVRALPAVGARALILTNAAGGLVPGWPVPCLMRIDDHVNMQGAAPPMARERAGVGSPYGRHCAEALRAAAEETGVALREGVYVGLTGPSYESPAEIRMLQGLGARVRDARDGPDLQPAEHPRGGLEHRAHPDGLVAGIAAAPLDHEEVVDAGKAIAEDFGALLRAAVPRLVQDAR